MTNHCLFTNQPTKKFLRVAFQFRQLPRILPQEVPRGHGEADDPAAHLLHGTSADDRPCLRKNDQIVKCSYSFIYIHICIYTHRYVHVCIYIYIGTSLILDQFKIIIESLLWKGNHHIILSVKWNMTFHRGKRDRQWWYYVYIYI